MEKIAPSKPGIKHLEVAEYARKNRTRPEKHPGRAHTPAGLLLVYPRSPHNGHQHRGLLDRDQLMALTIMRGWVFTRSYAAASLTVLS